MLLPTPPPPLGGVGGGLDGGCGGIVMAKEHGPPSFHGHDSADVTIAAAVGCWSRYVELTARWHFRGTLFVNTTDGIDYLG